MRRLFRQLVTGGKRILGYFPKFAVAFEFLCCRLEGGDFFEQIDVKVDFCLATGNLKVLELAANKSEMRLLVIKGVAGGKPGHNAADGDDVEDVHAFGHGSNQGGVMGLPVNLLRAAGNMRIAMFEGDEVFEAEIIDASFAVAADRGERGGSLDFDQMLNGTRELSAEDVRVGVIVERAAGIRSHGRHLS